MILFGLCFLLILTFLTRHSLFVFALVLFFTLFDMFDGFYKDDQIYAAIRYVVPLGLIAVYLIKHKALKQSDGIFLVLALYLTLLLIYKAGDFIISAKTTIATFITLLMIPIGRHLASKMDFIKEFEKYNRFLLIALPLYIIYANTYNIGESYTESFTSGYLITSRMYIAPILIFLAIHYAVSNKENSLTIKIFDLGLILVNICILIIITRRTSLGMLVGAMLVYLLLNHKLFFKMLIMVFVLIAALVFSYPLYEERLEGQLEKRERIQNLDTYEEEGRYLETVYLFEHLYGKADVDDILFGITLFDSAEFGRQYFRGERVIHSDINMLIYSTGLVGVILVTLFFIHYFFIGNSLMSSYNKKLYYPLLFMFLVVLLPGRFIGTLTYAPLLMLLLAAIKYHREISEENQTETIDQKLLDQQNAITDPFSKYSMT